MVDILIYAGPVVLLVFVAVYAYSQTPKFDDSTALDKPIDVSALRSHPEEIAVLAEKVSSVGVIQLPPSSASRSANDRYEGFVIDTAGHPNTFISSGDLEEVLDQSRWLAGALDIPLDDQT